jgi:hypothetical protein
MNELDDRISDIDPNLVLSHAFTRSIHQVERFNDDLNPLPNDPPARIPPYSWLAGSRSFNFNVVSVEAPAFNS